MSEGESAFWAPSPVTHEADARRLGYIAHRDFTPIECLPDDCLVKDDEVPLPWKDGMPRRSCADCSRRRRRSLQATVEAGN